MQPQHALISDTIQRRRCCSFTKNIHIYFFGTTASLESWINASDWKNSFNVLMNGSLLWYMRLLVKVNMATLRKRKLRSMFNIPTTTFGHKLHFEIQLQNARGEQVYRFVTFVAMNLFQFILMNFFGEGLLNMRICDIHSDQRACPPLRRQPLDDTRSFKYDLTFYFLVRKQYLCICIFVFAMTVKRRDGTLIRWWWDYLVSKQTSAADFQPACLPQTIPVAILICICLAHICLFVNVLPCEFVSVLMFVNTHIEVTAEFGSPRRKSCWNWTKKCTSWWNLNCFLFLNCAVDKPDWYYWTSWNWNSRRNWNVWEGAEWEQTSMRMVGPVKSKISWIRLDAN